MNDYQLSSHFPVFLKSLEDFFVEVSAKDPVENRNVVAIDAYGKHYENSIGTFYLGLKNGEITSKAYYGFVPKLRRVAVLQFAQNYFNANVWVRYDCYPKIDFP
jgi:hypothetical protein